ncbi:MAG: 7-carboxy-7-deazaguanine synthase [Saprospiraceae bacterium]|nr:7-carboxy-7-deazaguanine synthase [Saprospiraceae bacterium]
MSKTYSIKEMYFTIQGEGRHTGRAAVFCRFTGCNLWTGLEKDRDQAICNFCDTDFRGVDGRGGGKYDAKRLAQAVADLWVDHQQGKPFVVCTGGEPLLQLDTSLVDAFHQQGLEVAIETNGTLKAPANIDWICVSPKPTEGWTLQSGNELKLVFPQMNMDPSLFADWQFDHFYLQPMDGPDLTENTRKTVEYCLKHPQWSLSLQTHKYIGIP